MDAEVYSEKAAWLLAKSSQWENEVARGLAALWAVQGLVSAPVPNAVSGDNYPTKDAVRSYVLAIQVELAELLQTINWKPWKDIDDAKASLKDVDRTADEFADILAFLGVILNHLDAMGLTPHDLAAAYKRKTQVNIQRFMGEYGDDYRNVGSHG